MMGDVDDCSEDEGGDSRVAGHASSADWDISRLGGNTKLLSWGTYTSRMQRGASDGHHQHQVDPFKQVRRR